MVHRGILVSLEPTTLRSGLAHRQSNSSASAHRCVRGSEVMIMGNARNSRRAGRARLHRLRKDYSQHGDLERYTAAVELASTARPERSQVPSNWDQVIGRVEAYRRLFNYLSQHSMDRWYKVAEALRIEDEFTDGILGERVSLAQLNKIASVAVNVADDRERSRQLRELAAETRGHVWQQTAE